MPLLQGAEKMMWSTVSEPSFSTRRELHSPSVFGSVPSKSADISYRSGMSRKCRALGRRRNDG
jgi:hypothetical protein